jgi:hypothetical protein
MTLRFRRLSLRAETNAGTFGADLSFELGLNVLRANNTKGKSTCLQGLLYALGLERMLSPRREIPLTYVMTTHLEDPETGKQHPIIESSVSVELENDSGDMITVQRGVVSPMNQKLVSVYYGPMLTKPSGQYSQRDFFVLDPGAAQREAGFHRMLAEFIGWQLPKVRRFDGGEATLYLETIFPLLYVEQKAGWSSIPAAFPSYFQIRDVGRRAVEFLMGLGTHELELTRQKIDLEIAASKAAWAAKREELDSIAGLVSARVEGLKALPTIATANIERAFLSVADSNSWHPLAEQTSQLRRRISELRAAEVPTVEDRADKTASEFNRLTTILGQLNARRAGLFRSRQAELGQQSAIARRIAALDEDLQKNLDAQKLRNLGSKLTETIAADHCPTCAQPLQDTLLAQRVGTEVMPIEENIEYIRSQRSIFLRLKERTEKIISDIESQLVTATSEVNEVSARLRALQSDLVAPSNSPSIAVIEERLRLETRLQALEDAQQRFELEKMTLVTLAANYADLLAKRDALPSDPFTAEDKAKLDSLTNLIRTQANMYEFSTFPTTEIDISPENYRPQKEGFEIGFELSASDAIRLKWAYQIALMELARHFPTNHPGFVIFDEPRQQETAKLSFRRLLERAATAKSAKQQVIFATSEDAEQLKSFLKNMDCNLLNFDGPIVRKIQ